MGDHDEHVDFTTESAKHKVHVNLTPGQLTVWALKLEPESTLTDLGALSVDSKRKKGRSPSDKRVVDVPEVANDVDWGKVNIKLSEASFARAKHQAHDFLKQAPHVFVVDCFAGHDPRYRLKVRIFCTRAYHALFIRNMLIVPTAEELANFGSPDYTIYNAGECFADKTIPGLTSDCVVSINFRTKEQVILGTQYAGEMKKGVLTIMMYYAAKSGHLCMHASANMGKQRGDVTVFFGLSGTGKTTLSADADRRLIGDDEHVWTDIGIYNIEGGCYAKAVGLKKESEPEIYDAVRFGSVVENCILYPQTNQINFDDISKTENTRVAYPLSFIPECVIPAVGGHPENVVFLTNDAFGVMPPVALLTPGQAMYWFVTGYTAKVAGTEVGVKDPQPVFSPCFGGPFLVLHPTFYGKQLAEKLKQHNARCWLVNTGYAGGSATSGAKRMPIKLTRAIVRAINNGTLAQQPFEKMPGWNLAIPTSCPGVTDSKMLNPYNAWKDKEQFVTQIDKLCGMFRTNFKRFEKQATREMLDAMPQPWRSNAAKL